MLDQLPDNEFKYFIGFQVQIHIGGKKKLVGRLLAVKDDHIVFYNNEDHTISYYKRHHVKKMVKDSKEAPLSVEQKEFIDVKRYNDLFNHLRLTWVQISCGGPNNVEGVLCKVLDDSVMLISNEELIYIPVYHIKHVYKGSLEELKNESQPTDDTEIKQELVYETEQEVEKELTIVQEEKVVIEEVEEIIVQEQEVQGEEEVQEEEEVRLEEKKAAQQQNVIVEEKEIAVQDDDDELFESEEKDRFFYMREKLVNHRSLASESEEEEKQVPESYSLEENDEESILSTTEAEVEEELEMVQPENQQAPLLTDEYKKYSQWRRKGSARYRNIYGRSRKAV
ncbi:hypothetical protein [Bacillus taeanensis]|uniref:Spore coat protein n=1 Tax=Bacillus taeanensis TaxID=273032 RepID=A0A366XZ01_9BACI|nr:hypothetical protein [Bacillus taeanensis]RBW69989.1 hypothetical protein DS031_09055 [Bacillus taeanensis]